MPSLGPAEILVIFVVALLVLGPTKMPEVARQVGKGVRELRRVQEHLRGELRDVMSEFDDGAEHDTPHAASPSGDPVPTLPPRSDATDPPPPTGTPPTADPDADHPVDPTS